MRLTLGTGRPWPWAVGMLTVGMLTMVLALSATCNGSSNGSSSNLPTGVSFIVDGSSRFFSLIPLNLAEDSGVDYTDMSALVKDDNAADILEVITASWPFEFDVGLQWMGVMRNNEGIRRILVADVTEGSADAVREALEERGINSDTYRGVERWNHGILFSRWVAFLEDDLLLFTESKDDMESIIRHVGRGKKDSLWAEYESVIEKLPSYSPSVTIEPCALSLDGCERWVTAAWIEDRFDVKFELRAVFDTARDADRAEDDLVDLIETPDFIDDVEAVAEENQVIVTGFVDIEEAIEDDVYDIPGTR